jgi:adenylate cyclase
VAVIVPEDDFIGAVKKINRRVLIICLIILVIASIVMVYFSRRISSPILRIAEETDRIGAFQLDGRLELNSNIHEIQILQEAVRRMKASLRSFTRFAPERLVQEIVVQGKEAMLGGERRAVTLLFADLRNFTRFSDTTDPEEVVHLVNHHFDAMVRIIAEHGGYVVDFLGDSLFAVFGAPEIDPDHAGPGRQVRGGHAADPAAVECPLDPARDPGPGDGHRPQQRLLHCGQYGLPEPHQIRGGGPGGEYGGPHRKLHGGRSGAHF